MYPEPEVQDEIPKEKTDYFKKKINGLRKADQLRLA